MDNNIDYEKDYLVIYKNINGRFCYHRWIKAEKPLEQMQGKIERYNARQNFESEHFYTAELISDKLVREICAYKKQSKPLEDILYEVKELHESIAAMIGNFRSALESLEQIGE